MQKKARICCFCKKWKTGGIESFLFNTLLRLDFTQLQVDIVVEKMEESIFTQPLRERGISFFELSGNQYRICHNYKKFQMLLQERRWDVVHLNIFEGVSLYYLHLAKRGGVPIRIAHSHNSALRKNLVRPFKLILHEWARHQYAADATELWACSQMAAKFLFPKDELKRKGFKYIPNGINLERFLFNHQARVEIRAEMGLTGKLVVGTVGRLCYQKNQEFLLDVFAELQKKRVDSRLLLVGDGEDKEKLAYKSKQLGLGDRVIFCGTSDCVERWLWAMDIFAFPSRFEGLGIAIIEAQAAGLPVVCSDCVPEEACVLPSTRYLPLSCGVNEWVEALMGYRENMSDKKKCAAIVRTNGFDEIDVAHQVETAYLESITQGSML